MKKSITLLNKPNLLRLIFLLSLLGLGISSYLAYEYSIPQTINCPVGGLACETVRDSPYSHFMGISVPLLGIMYYFIVIVLTTGIIQSNSYLMRRLLFFWAISGLLFSIYFTALEHFVIKAYCFWCVTSAIICVVIFGLALKQQYENRN